MEITYTKYGDYLLPILALKQRKHENLNKYELLRLDYLKKNKSALYQQLLMQDKLYDHLFSVSIEAEEKVNYLIDELVKLDNTITEDLKLTNQMLWVQKMNNCKKIAEEIVLKELIYGESL
ncbi:MAG: TnpV protein [Bacilli bacterium]|nr:TnpV protein [Bacilli bacterium]